MIEIVQTVLLAVLVVELAALAVVLLRRPTSVAPQVDPAGEPENVLHQWGAPRPRPPKVLRPEPHVRGDCAFALRRVDGSLVGTRPPGHPDEREALVSDKLTVEYLEAPEG